MLKRFFCPLIAIKFNCNWTKKEGPSGEESSFKFSIMFGISPKVLNIIEKVIKAFTLIIKSIIAYRR